MEVDRDLFVRGSAKDQAAFMERVTERLPEDWRAWREEEREAFVRSGEDGSYCFVVDGEREGMGAGLFFARNQEGALYTCNVVPKPPRREMSRAECNAVVERFYELARPVAAELDIEFYMTEAERGIDAYLSPAALQKLRTFSGAANKSTGTGHPLDHRRWMDFVIQAHVDGVSLDSETLTRWLQEEEGWSAQTAWDLGAKFQEERAILRRYDEVR